MCVCGGGWGVCPWIKGSVPADWDCVLTSCEQVPAAGETEDPGPFTGWTVCLSQVTRGLWIAYMYIFPIGRPLFWSAGGEHWCCLSLHECLVFLPMLVYVVVCTYVLFSQPKGLLRQRDSFLDKNLVRLYHRGIGEPKTSPLQEANRCC